MMIQRIPCPPHPAPAAGQFKGLHLALLMVLPVALLFGGLEVVATPEHIAAMDPVLWLLDGPAG
ncbi:hypothetical protein [Dankookia sp. P2]|uniref:hypothetical protein n=1 Tax=Dankookia sp. P2 TaxID=3423955 RepID=UPI003D66C0D9